MKQCRLLVAILALSLMLVGCSTDISGESTVETSETRAEETPAGTDEAVERKDETVTKAVFPKELAQIPADYFEESESPGTLVELEYDTYESMTYEEQKQVLQKEQSYICPMVIRKRKPTMCSI